jgi:hypothetical protein
VVVAASKKNQSIKRRYSESFGGIDSVPPIDHQRREMLGEPQQRGLHAAGATASGPAAAMAAR